MTRLSLLLLSLLLSGAPSQAQVLEAPATAGHLIESARVTGVELNALSPGLRRDIGALAGTPLDPAVVVALAARIQAEHPDLVAAGRELQLPDGRVRLVFLIARINADADLASNINTRYPVERVDVSGIDETRISLALRTDLHALEGRRLEASETDRLMARLRAELPDYDVSERISRGSESGRLRLVFRFERAEQGRWLHFAPSRSKLIYHRDQGWSGVVDLLQGTGSNSKFALGVVWGNNDDLIEEYSGFSFRVENREAGTRRLGTSLEVARYTQKWNSATLAELQVNPAVPGPYRRRLTVQPAVSFALTKDLRVMGGLVASELDPLSTLSGSQRVNGALAEVGFSRTVRGGSDPRAAGESAAVPCAASVRFLHAVTVSADTCPQPFTQHIDVSYQLRAGTSSLQSDLIYRRHLGQARYSLRRGSSRFTARLLLGRITGPAPLFDRFALGDSSTLRGWNKFDIVPIGADRMAYQSLEYRYRTIAYFVDAGTIWSAGDTARVRLSTGIGVQTDRAFVTLGVPLNARKLAGTFMLGVRF